MNFIDGTLKLERDGLLFRESDKGTLEIQFPSNAHLGARTFAGRPIILGVRPEDVELAQFSKSGEQTAIFPAIIDVVEPMGAETNLYLQTGAHTIVCRSQRALDHQDAGRRQQFAVTVGKAHFFDPQTAKRVA
jgi:multiple sugar transport system ATP-binding protein